MLKWLFFIQMFLAKLILIGFRENISSLPYYCEPCNQSECIKCETDSNICSKCYDNS